MAFTPRTLASAGWIWNFLHEPAAPDLGTRRRSSTPSIRSYHGWASWPRLRAGARVLRAPERSAAASFSLSARRSRRASLRSALATFTAILRQWHVQETSLSTVLSMLNVEKYPPSLLYLMMTLGPGLMLLAAFERARGRLATWITTFGRVPMLYYVAHIFLIHALAVVTAWITLGDASWLIGALPSNKPAGWGFRLPGRLRRVAVGGRHALPDVPLVRARKAPSRRLVVELSLDSSRLRTAAPVAITRETSHV